jgi:hypothetical protein
LTDIPRGIGNHLEQTPPGMNKTGHPRKSPISENDIDIPVRGHWMDREKFGEERYLCMLLGSGSFIITVLLYGDAYLSYDE